MERSVTDHLPKNAWKKLDDPEMIDRPDLDTYVFCSVVDKDGVTIDNHEGLDVSEDDERDGVQPINHYPSDSHLFVRYGAIRDLILEGKVELLM